MKKHNLIKLKAAFLLVVFALNTAVGFACSLGVDMGYNKSHHQKGDALEAVVHIHKDGKKHIHHEKKEKSNAHGKGDAHQHDSSNKHAKPAKNNDCCSDQVRELAQEDKSLPNSLNLVHPVFATAFLAACYKVDLLPHTGMIKDIKQFVRSYHPPIPDIRIAIRSFQI